MFQPEYIVYSNVSVVSETHPNFLRGHYNICETIGFIVDKMNKLK